MQCTPYLPAIVFLSFTSLLYSMTHNDINKSYIFHHYTTHAMNWMNNNIIIIVFIYNNATYKNFLFTTHLLNPIDLTTTMAGGNLNGPMSWTPCQYQGNQGIRQTPSPLWSRKMLFANLLVLLKYFQANQWCHESNGYGNKFHQKSNTDSLSSPYYGHYACVRSFLAPWHLL